MKTLLLILLVLCTIVSKANNYYFSSTSGDDSRSAIQARSYLTPWMSLSKLDSIFNTLLPGDSILLKRGETFFGSIIINKSGTALLPIVIGAYGSGSKPVITGFATLTNWVSVGGGIYESYNSSVLPRLGMVTINDVEQGIGRYPNSDAANKGYLTLESHVNKTSITDNELPSLPNWKGAEVVIRTSHWTIDRSLITDHSGTTISYKATASYTPRDNYGYFIQNSIKTLDRFGEWYFDSTSKKLSVFFGSNNPSSYAVKAAAFKNLVYSSGKSYILFDNLEFKGANEDGIYTNGGSSITVQNCNISFSGIDGVNASGSKFQLLNSTVSYSNNDGVNAGNGSSCIIRNNVVKDSYFIAGMGGSGNGMGRGIVNGGKGLVEFNTVLNSGYIGIYLGGDYAIVRNNYVDSFCFVKDDAGGVYFANGGNATSTGKQIIGNVISNSPGAPEGTDGGPAGQGIYMDDNTNGVLISDNTVSNCSLGMFLHNSRQLTINNNTFFNNSTTQLYMKHDALGDPLRNHAITNNVFFAKSAIQLASSINTKDDDIGSTGRFDSNYYARPIDDKMVIFNTTYLYSSGEIRNYRDLDGWKSKYNIDMSSRKSAKVIKPYTVTSLVGLNKVINGDFSTTNIKPIWANSCALSYQNSGVLDSGYLQVSPSAASSNIVIGIAALSSAKKYLLRFSLKGTSNMSVTTYLRSSDYNPITPNQLLKVTASRSENEIIFSPSADQTSGSLVFKVDAQSTYYLDNIQLYEANAVTTNPDDSIKFVVNTTQVSKSFILAGNYVDVKNNKYSNSITLDPYTSAILISDNDGATSNLAPAVSITSPVNNAGFLTSDLVAINVSATDSDGSINKVDFYNASTLLGSDSTSPYSFTWNNIAAGNYTITAKATDNNGAVTTSSAVAIAVLKSNVAPGVMITSPSNNAAFTSLDSVVINAAAADSDGLVSKVDFYNNGTLLGSDSTAPYSFTWKNIAAGNYTVTAKATDNNGAVSTSSAVLVSVVYLNAAPTVYIMSPVNNTGFTALDSVTINVFAADSDGLVSKVEFYNNSTLLGSDSTSPYSFTWKNIAAGNYTIIAKATDNSAAVTTSPAVVIAVVKPNVAPAVTITSPLNNASFTSLASITINASAADSDGLISKVNFYNGSTLLGSDSTSPYSFIWKNVATGNYLITAKATDNSASVTTSAAVAISVKKPNAAPTVSITSPSNNASFNSPASIAINVSANDSDGSVIKVSFYNGSTYLGYVNTSPYSFTWKNVAAGNYTITSKATDNSGTVTTSAAVIIIVKKPNAAPVVNITSPLVNASFTSLTSITINANAGDSDGYVSKVDFYNGSTMLGSDSTSPYSFTWNNVAAGSYTITAKATDNSAAVTTSSVVAISVKTPNAAPAVSITSPLVNASFTSSNSITINTTAADIDGSISKVDFYTGSTMLGSDSTSPYSFTWNNVAAGSYSITAKATDNSAAVTTSSAVNIFVIKPNAAPVVSFIIPGMDTTYSAPGKVFMVAAASDTDGTISKVDFYNGATLLHTEYVSRYSFLWNNVPVGNYAITAVATDNSGNVTTSKILMVTVKATQSMQAQSGVNDAPIVNTVNPVVSADLAVTDIKKKINSSALQNVTIKVGPNPASNIISVTTNGLPLNKDLKISVLSMNGVVLKTIRTNTSSPVVQINVSTLTNGMYIVQVTSGGTKISERFIKD